MEKIINTEELTAQDKVLALRQLVRSLELKIQGYKSIGNGSKVERTPYALLTSDLIQKTTSLLDSFSKEANLISIKKKFPKQQLDTCMTQLGLLAREDGCPAENYELVMEIFHNTMINLGDIICNSRSYMELNSRREENNKDNGGF